MDSLGDLLLRSVHGTGVHVLGWDIEIRANVDTGDPRVLQDIIDEDAMVGVWLEYAS